MFYGIERFGEVQLKQNNWLLRVLALIYIFKCPRKTVLDGPLFQKTVLVAVYDLQDNFLQPISEEFCDDFKTTVKKSDWSEVINSLRCSNFGDESNITIINALKIESSIKELIT